MNKNQAAAYINSQTACAYIEAMGMQAENEANLRANGEIVHDKKAFDDLIIKYGIHHNAVHQFLFSIIGD